MSKRCRDRWDSDLPQKRTRTRNDVGPVDRLSRLSNELLLHILSFLPVSSLNVCQRLSHRFHALGGDSEIWKWQYYSEWPRRIIRPRSQPGWIMGTWHRRAIGNGSIGSGIIGPKGYAGLLRFPLSAPSIPSLMTPTALAVSQIQDQIEISVGLENGHFSLFILNLQTSQLDLQSSHVGCSDAAITTMALSSPYLMIVSHHKDLTLYNLRPGSHGAGETAEASEPRQIASLKADNIAAPMTLSLRVSSFEIVATIVYSFFHIGCGWSLGIQELHLGKDGQQLDSRLATTVDSQYGLRPLQSRKRRRSAAESVNNPPRIDPGAPSIRRQQPPTSMSYSHPYLLTSHADNTLTLYLVVSTSEKVYVQGGRRLWGHTSSVSAVQVTNRGKAVSVSSRGDEIRIWELEMAITSLGSRKFFEDNGVQINAGKKDGKPEPGPGMISHNLGHANVESQELTLPIGFDEERYISTSICVKHPSLRCSIR
ncbi:Cyclin-like F-box [Penicillium digitatum]|uniref:Probable E3 ubiquitin ligase complex SCF subunit sconB n=1 Tax=Penicillium digitatum TaxID=36651 RepID=A0A7T7BK33_PENDI|nr:Cyclin-like F-box [Penicillium digitatum]